MNKTKWVLWLLIIGFLGLVFYQNSPFFLDVKQSLRLNLWVLPEYQTPMLPVIVFFLASFVFGLILAYAFAVPERFRSSRTIKRLNASSASHEKEIAALKSDLAGLRGEAAGQRDTEGSASVTSPVKHS
jgi:uncharacterized integral membrane protein